MSSSRAVKCRSGKAGKEKQGGKVAKETGKECVRITKGVRGEKKDLVQKEFPQIFAFGCEL